MRNSASVISETGCNDKITYKIRQIIKNVYTRIDEKSDGKYK